MMQGPTARPRLTIAMIMVLIAFLAIAIAAAMASYRDRNRPDFMMAIWCIFAAGMAASGFSQRTGRALAGVWGEALATLGVFLAGEIWMELIFTPLPADSSVLHILVWNYWPSLGAFFVGMLGRYVARQRYDRLHPVPVQSSVA